MLVSAVGLYRYVDELLAKLGIEVDHVTRGPLDAVLHSLPVEQPPVRATALARHTTGRCPTDCPITSVPWMPCMPPRHNYSEQNAM